MRAWDSGSLAGMLERAGISEPEKNIEKMRGALGELGVFGSNAGAAIDEYLANIGSEYRLADRTQNELRKVVH